MSDEHIELTEKEVRAVAALARLGLTDDEIERFRTQLSNVLDAFAVLRQIDTAAIPPTASVLALQNVMAPDQERPSWPPSEILQNAPRSQDGFFRVPAVFGSGEEEQEE
jgi:aspartyl-tRNA(Asn)/glutamyl-tRNA(Gln) amidotransferase subunit C